MSSTERHGKFFLHAACAAIAATCLLLAACANQHEHASDNAARATPPNVVALPAVEAQAAHAPDPFANALPSWQDGATRSAIIKFIGDVTRADAPTYVPPESRIAVFDNDGTLWCEQPAPFQFIFMADRVQAAAPRHPQWQRNPAYRALVAHDEAALARNPKAMFQLLAEANSGMTTDEYDESIRAWLASARHPRFNRPYTELVYQPQLELLALLKANGFTVYIVSGGTTQFMRVWTEAAYGIPPERVIGTTERLKFDARGATTALIREPGTDFVNDGAGKPIGIYRAIGKRPILAFGNSDGDLPMLEYTASHPGGTLELLLHHDDAEREYAYDRASKTARLDKAWDEAKARGWLVVSMKQDWKTVFPAPKP